MALSNAQKIKIVTLLGWPAKVLDTNSTSFQSVVNARINGIDDDMEVEVLSYLERLEKLDEKRMTAIGRAGVKSVDDIEFFGDSQGGSSEFTLLNREKKNIVKDLASFLDVAVGPRFRGSGVDVVV